MKKLTATLSLTFAMLALCLQSLLPVAEAQQIKAVPPFIFDKAAYEKGVRAAFDGKVMGYATVLIKHGQVVSEVAGGLARNAADGNVKMTTSIPANIGSTIKFTGGVTLLHLFESKSRTRSMNDWLSLPIYTYFPKIWQDGMDASIKKITFRHLLQHRSGFPKNVSGEDLGDDGVKRMFDYLAAGVTDANFDKRVYANANVSLITYLIPMVANPSLLNIVNQEAAQKKWKAEEAPIHKRIADEWEKYMHGQIYSKITPAIKPSCNPTVEYAKLNKIWAPDYKSATDTGKGSTRDSRATNGYCQAQGGWYITARELAAFVANFNATNTLVSEQTRDLMFDDDNQNERLVWSFPISDPLMQQKFKLQVLPYMGGDHGGAHATILMLPNEYYAIGIINSNDMGSGGVTKGLLEAFKSGIGSGE
ncbi:MAG: serine hydrolase [Blastocatellia bacterium]